MNMFGTKYKTSAQVVWTGLSVETVMLSVLHLRMVKIVSKNASVSQVTVIMFSDVDGQNLIVKMVHPNLTYVHVSRWYYHRTCIKNDGGKYSSECDWKFDTNFNGISR
uniref:Uncharacterized protein LOC111103505 isoform X2 n=1 Tax=Crassostrea virginica TaxID=6565 RepID=A0A8B8AQT0_CRAVI|nr:uncharacterized protein LOC111103505 isoform X2 [Crassostrea virginica]XP_022294139.1 uncharacterized protein LOC111104459 isoform X2 [Crassostrea virginica]